MIIFIIKREETIDPNNTVANSNCLRKAPPVEIVVVVVVVVMTTDKTIQWFSNYKMWMKININIAK